MSVEYSESDIQGIQDKAIEIKELATKARMGSLDEAWNCLQKIITQANGIVTLLENGCSSYEPDEVELSR